jgi:DNA-binding transcriptional LysR family regulator
MELRHLRYFVAVADQGGFTRAAEQLGIAQPPLSQQIRQLEQELGVTLFQRLTRGVRLTQAGEILAEQARGILSQQQQFLASAAGLARGEQGQLRVGLAGAVSLAPVVIGAIRQFRQLWPDVVITLEESSSPAVARALNERTLDVAILRPPVPDAQGLVMHSLMQEPTLVALPSSHPLADQAEVALELLANDPLILFPRYLGPGLHDAILAACQGAGFTPVMGQQAPLVAAMVSLVAAGLGVAIVPASLSQIHAVGATFHAIRAPAPTAELAIATRATNRLPLVGHFVTLLREVCAAEGNEA